LELIRGLAAQTGDQTMAAEDEYMSKRWLTKFEQSLATWENNDDDTCDKAHAHFTQLESSFTDCFDVSDEARRLHAVMFNEKYDHGSPRDAIISAAVASAYSLAILDVAKRLGVDERAVRNGLEICETPDAERFVRECKSHYASRKERGAT